MLDVHPPHHPTHTWTDFFIHIATIVVGLLIAVGLEQTVERLHQRYELHETREALQREYESNRENLTFGEKEWLRVDAQLRNNLLVLVYIRQHPGTPQTKLPGDLRWINRPDRIDTAVWDAAEKNGITRLMPLEEANRHANYYLILSGIDKQGTDAWNAVNDAARYSLLDPDPTHMTPEQVDHVIELTTIALEKTMLQGYSYGWLANAYPDMPQVVTWDRMKVLRRTPSDTDPEGMAAAHQLSTDRINAAMQ